MREGICDGCGQRRHINRSYGGRVVIIRDKPVITEDGEYCADCWDEYELPEDRPDPTPPLRRKRLPGTTTFDELTRAVEEQDGPA